MIFSELITARMTAMSIFGSDVGRNFSTRCYTWFNRFCAFRFMDVKRYTRIGIVSPSEGQFQPEILAEAKMGHIDEGMVSADTAKKIFALLSGTTPSPDAQSEAYRLLIVAACNLWNKAMPFLFQRIADYTELLMPDDLLSVNSILASTREAMTPDTCEDVEILGWLYQFYISEKKDQVMARKSAVPTEDIPAVTQLFTPHWIVRYLVENSLGRLWLQNRPGSKLREQMPYYIEGEAETDFLKINKPEEIRLCDPACGSGHMLTYAFDLLTLIYEEEGYAPTEIPALILRHNLHGLEICPRAAQLAELALVFKAREKSRRFFQPEHLVRPRIIALRDVRFAENELRDYIQTLGLGDLFQQPVLRLLHQFEEAKNFGSLIQPCLDERAIADLRRAIEAKDLGGQLFLRETHLKVLRVLEQAEALTQRYHVVVANPPYMGGRALNDQLKGFGKAIYPEAKVDLFSMFMDCSLRLIVDRGYMAMITLPSWLFLSSFESFRSNLVRAHKIESLLHMGRGIFGIDWGSTAFVFQKSAPKAKRSHFFRLHERIFQHIHLLDIEKIFLNAKKIREYKHDFSEYRDESGVREISDTSDPNGIKIHYKFASSEFGRIPGCPIAYWSSPRFITTFEEFPPLNRILDVRQGMATTDNNKYLRYWSEPSLNAIGFGIGSKEQAKDSGLKWFPYNKGGSFRKWYGNMEYVVNWQNDGEEIQNDVRVKYPYLKGNTGLVVKNTNPYFEECITWSDISTGRFAGRYSPQGFLFDVKGSSGFTKSKQLLFQLIGFLCSKLSNFYLETLNPSITFQVGDIARIPFPEMVSSPRCIDCVQECVSLARADWDNFETSWDFRDQPLLRPGLKGMSLEASWRNWEAQSTAAIRRMQELETENNRLFITAYSLDGELQPEVPEAQITLARAEARRDMAAFLSYAVGCMMGRYSPDHPGLILANAGDSLREFLEKVGKPLAELTFAPDEDGIIPVLDGEWFEDDIVARTRDFLRATFGEASLRENLRFIEESMGKDLRKYFLTDFYKDHLQTYKKRPIYWLFSSPKGSFNALIYMHRYRPDTVSTVLQYLRDFRSKLTNHVQHLRRVEASADASKGEKTKALKDIDAYSKVIAELDAYERDTLYPLATEQISIDLNDGVKVNYTKFGSALKKIPGLEAKEE